MPHVVGDLLGRSTVTIVDLLGEQIACARSGARLTHALLVDGDDVAAARRAMAELEHDGDDARDRLVGVLARTLSTPIDREDLFRVSRSIDDVLDGLRDFVRQLDLYRVRHRRLREPVARIIDTLDLLDAAVHDLRSTHTSVTSDALAVKKASNLVQRSVYEGTASVLADGPPTDDIHRYLELFRRLEVVCGYLVDAADGLADAGIKRGG